MIAPLLFLIISTLTFYIAWGKKISFIKNVALKICFSWLLGSIISTFIITFTASILSSFTTQVLLKASLIWLTFLIISLFTLFRKILYQKIQKITKTKVTHKILFDIAIVFLFFLASYLIFIPHLKNTGGNIHRSPVYWDYHLHYPLIQNFTYGDNFPPQNESFSGFPHTYHYFFWVYCSIFSSLGLNLVDTINFTSILCFTLLLSTAYFFTIEIFRSRLIGLTAFVLILTSGSLSFLYFKPITDHLSLPEIINKIFTNKSEPFLASLINGNPFGYNGSMFNIFYYIEERQLIFSVIFLLFAVTVISFRNHISYKWSFLYGLLFGAFFQWHLFITVSLLPILLGVLVLGENRKKTILMLLGFLLTFGSLSIYFRNLTGSEWFYPEIKQYPNINFNFPTMPNSYPLSLFNAIQYYVFAYGLRIPFLIIGLFLLKIKKNKAFLTTAITILSLFLLTNSIQLSPISVYDNHKWLKPLNFIIDLVVAYGIVFIFKIKGMFSKLMLSVLFIPLILGGTIELMPFLSYVPSIYIGNEKADFIKTIRTSTKPQSSFLTFSQGDIHLAGRKTFTGSYIGGDLKLNISKRLAIANQIYNSDQLSDFCSLTNKYKIDYVEYKTLPNNLILNYMEIAFNYHDKVFFVNTNESCK